MGEGEPVDMQPEVEIPTSSTNYYINADPKHPSVEAVGVVQTQAEIMLQRRLLEDIMLGVAGNYLAN